MKVNKHTVMEIVTTAVLLAICAALAVSVIISYATASNSSFSPPRQESSAQLASNVTVHEVQQETFTRTIRVNGEVTSDTDGVSVHPDIGGLVSEVLVKKGDTIAVGDTVAMVDPSKPGAAYKASPVKSPVAGTVTSVGVAVGDTVGTSTEVAKVSTQSQFLITAQIPEKYLGTLQLGMLAQCTSVAWPDTIFEAQLTYIAPTVDATSRTVTVELELQGDTTGLKAGMFVSITLVTEMIEDALVIPSAAVSQYLGQSVVFVVKDGRAVLTPVSTSSSNKSQSVVTEGLAVGDLVITAGTAADGVSVNILQ